MMYLIPTPLKEFWPVSGSSVALGPWCNDKNNKDFDAEKMIPCPWSDNKKIDYAYAYVKEIYEEILPKLGQVLNIINKKKYSQRHWRIVIGPWLLRYINVIYDRKSRLELAQQLYPDLQMVGLDAGSFISPLSTLDYSLNSISDLYNLQLITRLAEYMGFPVSYKKQTNMLGKNNPLKDVQYESIKLRAYNFLKKFFLSQARVVMYCSYHPKNFLAKLLFISKGQIVECDKYKLSISVARNEEKREALQMLLKNELSFLDKDSFKDMLIFLISKEIPLIFLEGYSSFESLVHKKFGDNFPQFICSAVSWHYDDLFKLWSAKAMGQGTKLYGLQHGGDYGIIPLFFSCEHELSIVDGYMTWGWSDKTSKCKVIPTPAQKLLDIQEHNSNTRSREILYAGASLPRYLEVFPNVPENYFQYMKRQEKFFDSLSPAVQSLFRVRLYSSVHGWGLHERLKEKYFNLNFEDWNISFRDSLANCKMYISDYLSTTFVEALASNTPSVFFFDAQINRIRTEVEPYFNDFRRVGILHETPEGAAAWIEKIYSDIEAWWSSEICQKAVKNFCFNYAKTTDSPLSEWLKILTKL